MNAEETLKEGLEAYARLKKTISRIEQMIPSFEVPDQSIWGLMFYHKNRDIVNGYLVDAALDNARLRAALLRLESAVRSGAVAYDQVYQSMHDAYQRGEQDALRRLYDGLNARTKEALRLESVGVEAMTDADRAALRKQLLEMMDQK
jgi:hypothetical protein